MFRSILGFAVLAVLAWLGLKLIFGILGSLVGLAMTVLWLAFIGFVVYLALRLVSPRTADRVRDMIKGRPADALVRSQGSGCRGAACCAPTVCPAATTPPTPATAAGFHDVR